MICIVCGAEHSRRGQYCSKQCQQKHYYEKNKQERKEYKKQHYIEHRDEYAENSKKWIEQNRDAWNEYQRNWKREKKEREKNMERCEHYDFDCKEETCGCKGCAYCNEKEKDTKEKTKEDQKC